MFTLFTKNIKKIYATLHATLSSFFMAKPDEQTLKKIEVLLLESDMGSKTTKLVIDELQAVWAQGLITEGVHVQKHLKKKLIELISRPYQDDQAKIYMLVGINGSGKTTVAGKLAYRFAQQGKKVLLVAADTFRAAAVEQLKQWSLRTESGFFSGKQGQDPASVVFQGCQAYLDGAYDILIIDTAGRLQTKTHLMAELEKIERILEKKMPNVQRKTLLTIDAMLGQNSLDQARVFNESTHVDGLILTKIDGTGKGGIVFSIGHELAIPIAYISCGETSQDLLVFDPEAFVTTLIES